MAAESCKGRAIEEKEALGGRPRRCSGGRAASCRGSGLLVVPQQGDLVVGQAELRIGDGIGW